MANQEREVKLLKDFNWDDRWVAWLGFCTVGVWRDFDPVDFAIGCSISMSIHDAVRIAVCPNTLLDCLSTKRWSDGGWLAFRGNEVVRNVLDKETFPLILMSFVLVQDAEIQDRSARWVLAERIWIKT